MTRADDDTRCAQGGVQDYNDGDDDDDDAVDDAVVDDDDDDDDDDDEDADGDDDDDDDDDDEDDHGDDYDDDECMQFTVIVDMFLLLLTLCGPCELHLPGQDVVFLMFVTSNFMTSVFVGCCTSDEDHRFHAGEPPESVRGAPRTVSMLAIL